MKKDSEIDADNKEDEDHSGQNYPKDKDVNALKINPRERRPDGQVRWVGRRKNKVFICSDHDLDSTDYSSQLVSTGYVA